MHFFTPRLLAIAINSTKKFLLISFALLIFTATVDAADKLRVAVIIPLSGDAASFGESIKRGMTLGIEKLSPKAKESIEFVFEDDKLDPKTTVAAFNKINSGGKVDVVFNLSSATAQALAPITEAKKIVFLAAASDGAVSKGRKYAFNYWVTPAEEARVVLAEAKRRGYKKIVRIQAIHNGVFALRDEFNRQNDGEIKIVLDEDYPPDVRDFRPFLTRLRAKAADIDAINVVLLPGQYSVFGRQLAEMGFKKDLFGYELFEDKNEVMQSKGTLVGAWYANAADADGRFLKDFERRYPGATSYGAATGYDFVGMLGAAVDRGVKADELNVFFATLKDFTGALGTYSATGDQKFNLPAMLKVVTTDGFKELVP